MEPCESRALDFFAPGHGIACRGKHDLEPLLHLRIFFHRLNRGVDRFVCLRANFGGYHYVDAKNSLFLPGALEGLPENLLQHRVLIVFMRCTPGLDEPIVNLGLTLPGIDAARADKAEHSRVSRGNA
jgi:hypothetical protein